LPEISQNTLSFIILLNLYYSENAGLVFAEQLSDCFQRENSDYFR
jgi:hypothetical protein